ncbi:MAG: BrnT family toxin [Candidatus Bipolaricaulota bacterium]|nr:BrnT family toxin [Candidatus Bipolaricaulota bacterium]
MHTVEFEFDPAKSAANKAKHGIDFVRAQALWNDPDLIAVPARTSDEPSWVVVGRTGDAHWSAIIARREERIRIISMRRSRREEVSWYEGEGS